MVSVYLILEFPSLLAKKEPRFMSFFYSSPWLSVLGIGAWFQKIMRRFLSDF